MPKLRQTTFSKGFSRALLPFCHKVTSVTGRVQRFWKNHSAQLFIPRRGAVRPMVTATDLFFQVLRAQLWTTGFDSQLALRRQRNRAREAHEAPIPHTHTHLAPFTFPFRHKRHRRHKQFWEFFRNECKAPRAPKFCRAMGAMRPSINACQKIVKIKYYPNCLNLRNCLSCLPARASSLSVGKNITNISRSPFLKFLLAQASFSASFLVRVAGRAVGVRQAARLGVWY